MTRPVRYASQRELAPNISALPVARDVVTQAVVNSFDRAQKVAAGEMTFEQLEEANLKLVLWLEETFCARNPHFYAETEFNRVNFARYLRASVGEELALAGHRLDMADDEAFVFAVFAYFVSEIFEVLKTADVAHLGLVGNHEIAHFVERWAMRFTGAPITKRDIKVLE